MHTIVSIAPTFFWHYYLPFFRAWT